MTQEILRPAPVARAIERLDKFLVLVLEKGKNEGFIPTCRRGCSACCSEPVYVERREAEHVIEAMKKLPQEEQDAIMDRLRVWLDKIRGQDILKQRQPDVIEYRKLRLPCPLLNQKNGDCLVYANRPMGCRLHFAIGPRENCEDDAKRRDQTYMYVQDPMLGPILELLDGKPGDILMEHLGLHLAEILLGEKVESESRSLFRITNGKGSRK